MALDPVGGKYAEPTVRSMSERGRYLVVGFASGEIPRIPLNLPLLKNCAIVGSSVGQFIRRDPEAARAMIAQLFAWVADGRLRPPLVHTYPLTRAAEAVNDLAGRRAIGKIVLLPT